MADSINPRTTLRQNQPRSAGVRQTKGKESSCAKLCYRSVCRRTNHHLFADESGPESSQETYEGKDHLSGNVPGEFLDYSGNHVANYGRESGNRYIPAVLVAVVCN